ncbi:MAG: DUF123 domain-containing protein [Denitrovibrio sp.]|nr:MAG: DUF123 domain-containing protein [Denitrovibrio sp.]
MKDFPKLLPPEKGVYVLFLRCTRERIIRVGSIGELRTKAGIYAYVGSAYGGGGIKSRLGRHLKTAKKCRWHIDYIRRFMSFHSAWYTLESADIEHKIAEEFIRMDTEIPMKGFGSSDCKCHSHLFFMEKLPIPFFKHLKRA